MPEELKMVEETSNNFSCGNVSLKIRGSVAKLTISSPPVNAVGLALVSDISSVLDHILNETDATVIRITSDLRVFSAGADLKEVDGILNSDTPEIEMRNFVETLHRLNDRIETMSLVTVAELQGAAIGGGLELALACDFRLANHSAKVGLPEASLGLIPGAGGTQRLKELAGISVARKLILSCEIIDAETALSLGVIDKIFDADSFDVNASQFAHQLATNTDAALSAAKLCLAQSGKKGFLTEITEISKLAGHEETKSRINQFLKHAK
ncbi:MAG: enoyl-CoA hydratase/isomerase family protein [Rhizobiaceae bacterium]